MVFICISVVGGGLRDVSPGQPAGLISHGILALMSSLVGEVIIPLVFLYGFVSLRVRPPTHTLSLLFL